MADREFSDSTWLDFLRLKDFSFVIRLPQNMYHNELSKQVNEPKDKITAYISNFNFDSNYGNKTTHLLSKTNLLPKSYV